VQYLTLFPKIPYRHQRGRLIDPSVVRRDAAWSAEEMGQVRRDLLTPGVAATCPRCRSALGSKHPPRHSETGALVWLLRCDVCKRDVCLRILLHAPPHRSFDRLSVPSRQEKRVKRSLSSGVVSLVAHSAVLTAAVLATASSSDEVARASAETTMVFLAEPTRQHEVTAFEPMVVPQAVLLGFQNVTAVVDVPYEVPPIDRGITFDPRDYTGIGYEGGRADGLARDAFIAATESAVVFDAVGREPAVLLSAPNLAYPPLLKEAGLEGIVVVEFVVDTLGQVDESSIVFLESSYRAFSQAVLERLRRSVFRPARIDGQLSRARVGAKFRFQRRATES